VSDLDGDGYPEVVRIDADGDGTIDTTYVDADADGRHDATLVGPSGPSAAPPHVEQAGGLLERKGVLPGPSADLLEQFLGDPTASAVEVRPDFSPRALGSVAGIEVWSQDAQPLRTGGLVVSLETRSGGHSVPVDVMVRVRDGKLAVDAVGTESGGFASDLQAGVVDQLLGSPSSQINAQLEATGRELVSVTYDEATGRLELVTRPR
jgi:hypothetical protein